MTTTTELRGRPAGDVIDLGAGENPDARADATADIRPVADYRVDLDAEWPWPQRSLSGVIARHVLEHVADVSHFFAEAGRVLQDGGWLEVTVPLGKNALADDDHERVWQWTTPTHYCRERQRGWDPETAFVLVGRELNADLQGVLAPLNPLFRVVARVSPGEAAYRCSAGELTATYRRVDR